MVLLNYSQTIGKIIIAWTNNISGSLFLTTSAIVLLILLLAFTMRIPIELTAPLIFPMLLVLMAYSSEYLMMGGIISIYLTIIFIKTLFIN